MFTPQYSRQGRTFEYITEAYVSSPPAAYIISNDRKTFCLGFLSIPLRDAPEGHYAYNVLVDGIDTHEFASHIEKRNGRVRILTRQGWKTWSGHTFV